MMFYGGFYQSVGCVSGVRCERKAFFLLPSAVLFAAGVFVKLRGCCWTAFSSGALCGWFFNNKQASTSCVESEGKEPVVCGCLRAVVTVLRLRAGGPTDFNSGYHSARSLINMINQSTNEQKKQKERCKE